LILPGFLFIFFKLACINQFYDLSGQDILEAIRKNDISTMLEMSRDLEQWEDGLSMLLADFNQKNKIKL